MPGDASFPGKSMKVDNIMKDFTLAMVQHDSYLGTMKENLQKTKFYTVKAKKAGADLVVFPEINITGHAAHESLSSYAVPVPNSEPVQELLDLARAYSIYIVAGIVESDGDKIYNTSFIVGPSGYIGKQRKLHLSLNEALFFSEGDCITTFSLPFAKVGIVICYDCTFPEVSRCLCVDGAELILFCNAARHVDTDWIEWSNDKEVQKIIVHDMKDYLSTITRCRALENRCYVGVCNMTGESGKYVGVKSNHAGGSFIIDPYGKIMIESEPQYIEEALTVAKLSSKPLEILRSWDNSPFKKRRPSIYKNI